MGGVVGLINRQVVGWMQNDSLIHIISEIVFRFLFGFDFQQRYMPQID